MALLVAMAPLAQVLCLALASTKQAVPQPGRAALSSWCTRWQVLLPSEGSFPVLMRLGRLGPSSLSALIKVLAALPGGVGGLGPMSRPAGDAASRCSPTGREEAAVAAVLTALPGRAQSEGPVGCGDLGTVAAAACPLTDGVLPVPIARGPGPPLCSPGSMGGWRPRPSDQHQPGAGSVAVLWVMLARGRMAFGQKGTWVVPSHGAAGTVMVWG